jgi:AcrR family transcriptional regulator
MAGSLDTTPITGRRAEIRDAAAVLFESEGYYNTSMEMISDKLGIQKPTLYYYVESKGQLVAWIHDGICDQFIADLQSRIDSGLSPRECLQFVILQIFETFENKPGHLRVFFENHREIPDRYREVSKSKRDTYFNMVKGLIQRGIEEGIFKDRDPDLATFALFGMCNWSYQWYRRGGRYTAAQVSAEFWRIFGQGLEAQQEHG